MSQLAITKETAGSVDQIIERVSEAIKPIGFGVLTRIDFDQKMKEKLGETIPRTVILGACNPKLAFEAYQQTTDITLLVPCNIVIRDIGKGKVAIEAIRPSMMAGFLPAVAQSELIKKVEMDLEKVIMGI